MLQDFTLRGVALTDFRPREEALFDLTFQGGRLVRMRPLPSDASRHLFATPGFFDAHHHVLHHGLTAQRCNLSGCSSLREALDAIAAYRDAMGQSSRVIWAERWDESRWPEQRMPTREEIDQIAADRPVVMRRICGHIAIVNSLALEEARRHWPEAPADGCLTEDHAMGLARIWIPNRHELEEAFMVAQDDALAMGITRMGEMGAQGALDAYIALAKKDMLKVDIELTGNPREIERLVALREEGLFSQGRLHLGGVKAYADGSVGARTAALREPYRDRAHTGRLLLSDDELRGLMIRCREVGMRLLIHAIGDAAIDQIIRQVMQTREERGPGAPGWVRIEHAELLDDELLDRIAEAGIDLSLQPNFVDQWARPGGLYETALGEERTARMNPFRTIWDREIPMAFGSDGMPMNPAIGLRGAVQHPNAAARLTPAEALATYLGARAVPGRIWEQEDWWRIGQSGAVLYGHDPLDLANGELSRVPVLGVFWGGEWVLEPAAELFRSGVVHDG